MARYQAFQEEHAVFLQHLNEKDKSGEIDTSQYDAQDMIMVNNLIADFDNPEDKAAIKSFGQADNFAYMKYCMEIHNQSLIFEKEIKEAVVELKIQQREILEPMMTKMKVYIAAGQKDLNENGPDPAIEEAVNTLRKKLDKLLQEYIKLGLQIDAMDEDKQN